MFLIAEKKWKKICLYLLHLGVMGFINVWLDQCNWLYVRFLTKLYADALYCHLLIYVGEDNLQNALILFTLSTEKT